MDMKALEPLYRRVTREGSIAAHLMASERHRTRALEIASDLPAGTLQPDYAGVLGIVWIDEPEEMA